MRVRLTLEFDGTDYAGFQRQSNAVTIQQLLEENLEKVTGAKSRVTGCSRTDSGVHAKMFVAHFDTQARMPAEKYCYALNAGLPKDIRVFESREADQDFHARFDAKRKHYRYTINNSEFSSALSGRFEHHCRAELDFQLMQTAAGELTGEHDFSCFMAAGGQTKDPRRTIFESRLTKERSLIHYDVIGNGFLYNMVRIIAGTLIEIGRGELQKDAVSAAISSKSRLCAGPTAPAQGLTLMNVEY